MNPVINGTSTAAEHTESGVRNQWPTKCFFQAPAHIRAGRKSYFEPKFVSIGPYYHGREYLKRMEELKLRCIPNIPAKQAAGVRNPRRYNEPVETSNIDVPVEPSIIGVPIEPSLIDVPIEPLINSGEKARAYYKREFGGSNVEFVRMLVLDSCFIIRIILAFFQPVDESMSFLDVHMKELRSDLLLLENQIPLFFIREVYECLFSHLHFQNPPPFNTVLEPFICLDMPWKINRDAMSSEDAANLLDHFWRCSSSPGMYKKHYELEIDISKREEIHLSLNMPIVIANATELQKTAGIEFEKCDKGHLDIIFSNGILQMPRLKIDQRQITLLLNLIAFENCIVPSKRAISTYMKLMDALINSGKDVQLLEKCGVIYNTLNNPTMAANFFNDIGSFCFIDTSTNPLSGLSKNVQEYYDSSWHRRLATLRHNYFNSAWASFSAIAAPLLLILTLLQTFYAIYGYHHPKY